MYNITYSLVHDLEYYRFQEDSLSSNVPTLITELGWLEPNLLTATTNTVWKVLGVRLFRVRGLETFWNWMIDMVYKRHTSSLKHVKNCLLLWSTTNQAVKLYHFPVLWKKFTCILCLFQFLDNSRHFLLWCPPAQLYCLLSNAWFWQ